jgi:uncharacterized protein YbjQ (UPF0145 family)
MALNSPYFQRGSRRDARSDDRGGTDAMAKVTGLSGNEIYCLALKQYSAGELVVGNSVNSMGFLGSLGAGVGNVLGGEVPQVTQAIHEGRLSALKRMTGEAMQHGASGVAGVFGELRSFSGSTEFLFVGSCVHGKAPSDGLFTTAGDAQELYCHMDAGYEPIQHAFGNIAYSMGVGGGILGSLKTLARGEIKEFSDVFNHTRHAALDRVVGAARQDKANAVVGLRTTIQRWAGTHEMIMSGTAAVNLSLPGSTFANPVTSDMTGEELWAMTSGFMAAFKSFSRGEINELTRLVHDAREIAIDRIKREADQLGAEEVVGVKTYIAELQHGLVEFMAIGTAVTKAPGLAVATPTLPVQAIIQDKDTWIDGDFGFSLDRAH